MNKVRLSKVLYLLIGIFLGILFSAIFLLINKKPLKFETICVITPITASDNLTNTKANDSIESIDNISAAMTNLNTCTLDELESLPGIGESKAMAILEFRDKYGAFSDISELRYVPGIGESLYNDIKKYLFIENDKE